MPAAAKTAPFSRLGLRATPEQGTPLDQRLFLISGDEAQSLLGLLDRPETANPGLADRFSRRPPWAEP